MERLRYKLTSAKSRVWERSAGCLEEDMLLGSPDAWGFETEKEKMILGLSLCIFKRQIINWQKNKKSGHVYQALVPLYIYRMEREEYTAKTVVCCCFAPRYRTRKQKHQMDLHLNSSFGPHGQHRSPEQADPIKHRCSSRTCTLYRSAWPLLFLIAFIIPPF